METSAFNKGSGKAQGGEETDGFGFRSLLLRSPGCWVALREGVCFFWAVCFAAICVSACCRIETNWRDTSHLPWCNRLGVKLSVIVFQFRFFQDSQ